MNGIGGKSGWSWIFILVRILLTLVSHFEILIKQKKTGRIIQYAHGHSRLLHRPIDSWWIQIFDRGRKGVNL